ncbi:Flp family type IVb pilin [Rhizobium helianthi]|uniref:Flp family type IVb pilin n=1 Tax=Rhizobium helianthi TaxID=1132695 RepID=A0ABW4M2M4_9HYPH
MSLFRKLFKDERGATAVEYGLLAAIIGGILIVAFELLSGRLQAILELVASYLKG